MLRSTHARAQLTRRVLAEGLVKLKEKSTDETLSPMGGQSMLLQGDLQRVFDALYQLGVIEPVLQLDWVEELKKIGPFYERVEQAMRVANSHQQDIEVLTRELRKFDPRILNFLAMEVAREYAEFETRNLLH